MTENAFHPRRDGQHLVDIDAGRVPAALQQIHNVLRRDVPRRVWRERAAADTSERRVQHRHTGLARGQRIGQTGIASVVEVSTKSDV